MKKEKISADTFLACMAYEFPGLVSLAGNIHDDVNGGDLVDWIASNLQELKTNVRKNMEREATIRIGESVGVRK